jgi:hypothetical protein
VRLRFAIAYGLLVLAAATAIALAFTALRIQPRQPVAPGAVRVVEAFMSALAAGDTHKACRLFSDLPACDQRGTVAIRTYRIFPAEYTLDGVAVRVTIDDAWAEIDLSRGPRGAYRITTIIADPSPTRAYPALMV